MTGPDSTGERLRESTAQSGVRFRILAAVVLFGFGILIGRSIHPPALPTLSVIGLSRTNGITDRALVNFHNRSSRAVDVSYQIRSYTTHGWKVANDHDPNAGIENHVRPGCSQVFSVVPPSPPRSLWAVVCSFEDNNPGPVTRWTRWLGDRMFHRQFMSERKTVHVDIDER
ncbi:MAG: hypothetical protein JNL10_05645 [Verrucomicrobiales bacterium]|nr:hypothetical protein [Verrucomicrobiales bacterium]